MKDLNFLILLKSSKNFDNFNVQRTIQEGEPFWLPFSISDWLRTAPAGSVIKPVD